MTTNEILNKAIQNWGMEDESTIEIFQMAERGENTTIIRKFYELVESALHEDFGFN